MPLASKPIPEPEHGPLHTVLLRTYLQLLHSRPVLTKALTSAILSALGNLLSQRIERRRQSKSSVKNVDLVAPLRFAAYGFHLYCPKPEILAIAACKVSISGMVPQIHLVFHITVGGFGYWIRQQGKKDENQRLPDPDRIPIQFYEPARDRRRLRLFFTGPLSHYFYLFLEQWVPSSVPLAGLRRLLLDRLIIAPAFLLLFFIVMNFLEGKDLKSLNRTLKENYWSALKMNWKVWTPFQFINVNYVPVQFRVLFANMVAFFWYTYLASTRK